MVSVTIIHKGIRRTVDEAVWRETMDEMVRDLGPWDVAHSRVERRETVDVTASLTAAAIARDDAAGDKPGDDFGRLPERRNSDFGSGKQIIDGDAKTRIEATHDALQAAGVNVDAGKQLYATGTRMADVGYSTQAQRATEHAAKMPAKQAAAALVEAIRAERRRDVEVDAATFGKRLDINGALTFEGYKVREQAVRGLLARLGSPALTYVLGLRSRMSADDATAESKTHDRAELLHVLKNECERFGNVPLKLRTRDGLGDIFATVSPQYAPADAPDVLPDVLAALPDDARATFAYDPESTAWELRASVFTPTPVDEQAVGEPFEGFVSFGSRDNGTRSFDSGGGILLLACLNAGIYTADSRGVTRRHVGRILVNLHDMTEQATAAIRVLCKAWGTARGEHIVQPVDGDGVLVPLEEAIPGFFRHMLTARKGEMVGVLPGRTEKHVEALAEAFGEQRRDRVQLVRADIAQAVTRYIQTQPAPVRRDAEQAIGRWMVNGERVGYLAA